jgi:hypothetical protein
MCRLLTWGFAAAYGAALLLLLLAQFGLVNGARSPESTYLVVLGWPWLDRAARFPETVRPLLPLAAPAINVVIIAACCRVARWIGGR